MSVFIKYDGIEGQASDEGHKGWMRVDSMEWGIQRNINSDTAVEGEREAGNATVSDLTITRRADKATPKLVMAACCGKGKDVEIDVTRTGEGTKGSETYLKYTLKNALVSNYRTEIVANKEGTALIPVEHITLAFVEFTVEHTPYDNDGNAQAPEKIGFNTATNKKV
ncbi:MAG: type VI secretion system tube protein Hcp [Limnobacter sp.]|nr:type VI secretion system tube protein Hcp [Limnobacter sp.]